MDVFKYLKKADAFLAENDESQARKDAERAGGVTSKFGKYYNDKGQYVGKIVGDKFQAASKDELLDRMAKSPAGQEEPEQKTLSQFKKEVPQEPQTSVGDQMGRVIPGGPTSTAVDSGNVKEIEKGLMRGRGNVMSPARKDQIKQQARDILGQLAAEKEAEDKQKEVADAQAEAELAKSQAEIQAINDAEAEQIDVDDYKTLDDVVAETQDEIDYANDDEAFDSEYEEFTKEAETLMKTLADRQRKMMEKKFARFQESLSTIPSVTDKRSFLQSMAHAKTFEGRVNAGAGKNNLGYADVQNLMANRDRLLEGYGDGSPEQIKKFVDSVRSNKVSDEFIDASFDILPDTFKKSLSGKGQVTNDKYVSDDKAHKDMHYLGKNEDGTVRRGAANNKDRAKLMWRIYLEQGGRDAYTGLPLDRGAMDLEHVRGFNNKDGGAPGKEQWEQRENDDNFTLINSNINQKKVDMSMKDFFER